MNVPNKCPFKEDILKEAQRLRDEKQQQKLEEASKRKEAKASTRSLTALAADAQARQKDFEASVSPRNV